MLEHIPENVENALLYFHSAGTTSEEIAPFFPQMIERLPNTYILADDGVIGGSPLMRQGAHYGPGDKRYWFTFPMQDASSPQSFANHNEAMGATLTCGGAYVNALTDQIMARFRLAASQVVLCGYQHGGCVALAASMMRVCDPYAMTILLEPYLLESFYLQNEPTVPETKVVCIDNQFVHNRTRNWLGLDTGEQLRSFGLNIDWITVKDGDARLGMAMVDEAISVVGQSRLTCSQRMESGG